MIRLLSITALLVVTLASSLASAEPVQALFDQLASASDKQARQQAVDRILAVDPVPTDEVVAVLERKRTSTDADRRAVLRAHDLDVPDEKGRFRAPGRQTKRTEKENDELDWLAELSDAAASPSVSDVLVDIAAIRALAASKSTAGAKGILQFVFSDDGTAYRDEGGRYLRRMAPWSLPGLIWGAYTRKNPVDMRRYAKYQLERLDREAPRKALHDAPTDEFKAETLKAFSDSQYREAVFVVLDTVNHGSPEVRAAAREAWLEYATGRPAPKPPKQKLQLPGGKQTDEEHPLWLDHRELANIAIRRRLEELTGEKPERSATLAEMSQKLFDHYDQKRKAELDEQLEAGLEAGRAGKLDQAAGIFDRILVQQPHYQGQAAMAEVYLAYGQKLEEDGKHREAATAFGKAHSVDPGGKSAEDALSRHYRARAKALEAEGKDGATALERAKEIDAQAGGGDGGGGDDSWLLYVGVGGAVGGLLMLIWGLIARRRGARWSA